MTLYGYARVSTTDQDLSLQEAALRTAGCQVIRAEKRTGTRRDGRSELDHVSRSLDVHAPRAVRLCLGIVDLRPRRRVQDELRPFVERVRLGHVPLRP